MVTLTQSYIQVTNEPATVTQNGQMIVFPAPLRPARPMRNKPALNNQGPMPAVQPGLNHVGNRIGPNTNHFQSGPSVPHHGRHGSHQIPEYSPTLPDYDNNYNDQNLGSVQSENGGNMGTFVFIAIVFIILIIVAVVFVRKELKKSPHSEPMGDEKMPEKA